MIALLLVAGWEMVSQQDGVSVERRALHVDGRDLYELRVSGASTATPEQIGETLWAHQEYIQFVPHLKRLDILSVQGDVKIVYQQVKLPVVTDRDYTLRIVRSFDAATRVYESKFEVKNELGPAESSDYVRIKTLHGQWTISPGDRGGSEVVYQVLTDPGPSIPAWILSMAQKAAAPDLVKAMIGRAQKTHAASDRSAGPGR